MRKKLLSLLLLGMVSVGAWAQRTTDIIGRELVAVKTSTGIYCSWRIFGEEYYEVKYNIMRNGVKLNNEPLNVSNFTDNGGTVADKYTVQAVVRGVPQPACADVTPWADNYMDIKLAPVLSRNGGDLTSSYEPNDVSVADLDGDGEVELLLKRISKIDGDNHYSIGNDSTFNVLEAYKLDGTRLWWIDCGPNMVSGSSVETNIVAYDWDGDGKAEIVLRGADGMIIHMADGTTQVVGDAKVNTRDQVSHTDNNLAYTHTGAEYLLYLEGITGKPYQIMTYPLTRGNASDWGDNSGHRSSKYFFGAPFLDGRKPSIFLARGIYTRHKMAAYDVDPTTHTLKQRWYWQCLNSGSAWYGNGYHNYGIADVDWDGRDEIVYGSMVIDDNGKGLSTTGLGHGDAQHCSDFDPYTHGQEIFACNETRPSNNYRDATTSKIYYRKAGGNDDGRCMMGNFSNDIPGCLGVSASDGHISSITGKSLGTSGGIDENFRIYWDGDLQEETFNYTGFEQKNGYYEIGNPRIYKYGVGQVGNTFTGSLTCNGSKGTPSFQGDIIGDWREDLILRTEDGNLRLFTSTIPTTHRNYSLWHDHQYRQAMVWEMCGYNQPPHTSYFLGELENITIAPPPLTMTGRTEIANNGTINASVDDKHAMMCETGDMTVAVAEGAKPYIFTDNAPTWVQGNDNNDNIVTTAYTHTLTGGAFTGAMRLVKQGDGSLVLPNVTETYTGNTDVWAGVLNFDGTMQSSRVWLNRHTTLISNGGKFMKSIQADYNATIIPGGENNKGAIETDSLILNFGSRLLLDVYSEGISADMIKANVLKIEKKNWQNGPRYSTPVVSIVSHAAEGETAVADGKYLIGEVGKVEGDINDIVIEGLNGQKSSLSLEDGKLYITIANYVAGNVTWTGSEDGNWNLDETTNFVADGTQDKLPFVPGDAVTFDDNAVSTTITVVGNIAPGCVTFNNNKVNLTITGDSLVGNAPVVKNGAANVTINNVNSVGNTTINAGKITVSTLANEIGQDNGSLGGVKDIITVNNNATLGISQNVTAVQPIIIGEGGATVEVAGGKSLTMSSGFRAAGQDAVLTKSGSGTLNLGSDNKMNKLLIKAGTVNAAESDGFSQLPTTVEFIGGTLYDSNSEGSYTTNRANFVVDGTNTGTFYADPRCDYTGTLTGTGTFKVYAAGVRNTFSGDWSAFEGTLVPGLSKRGSYDPSFDFNSSKGLPKATLNLSSDFTFNNNGKNVEIGKVTGSGTLAGTGTYIIGTNNSDFTFGVNSTSKIIKRGTGKMTLLTMGKINASLTIENGILSFNDVAYKTMVIGKNTMTVSGTGSIIGRGYVNSLIMNGNSTLTVRSTYSETTPGKLKTSTILNAGGSSVVNFLLADGDNSTLEVGSSLSLTNINITLADGYTPKLGDEFTLWTCKSLLLTPTNITLPQLPSGLYWDTTALTEVTGVLKVTDTSTGIDGITTDADNAYDVYTVGGVKVGSLKSVESKISDAVRKLNVEPGTYIIRCKTGVRKVIIN